MSNNRHQQQPDPVEITNVRNVSEETGKHVADQLDHRLNSIESNTRETASALDGLDREIERLQRQIEDLEDHITEIERTKAEAEQNAKESIKATLKEQYEDKKEAFKQKKASVLGDYQASIRRLKDRFVNSIPGQSDGFDQVQDEFNAAMGSRRALIDTANAFETRGPGALHEYRLQRLEESRSAFADAAMDFLDDREATANTIDELQTPIPNVNGNEQLNIPFWVVGIERDGREEVHVLPIQTRAQVNRSPTDASPYVDYLEPHRTHDYTEWTDLVKEYVTRDMVRDKLAKQDPSFADPGFLKRRQGVSDRFVEAFQQYELQDRSAGHGTQRDSRGSTNRQQPGSEQAEVSTDD